MWRHQSIDLSRRCSNRTSIEGLLLGFRLRASGWSLKPTGSEVASGVGMAQPQIKAEPKPPFPRQKLRKPGIEADLEPRPKYRAARYKAAGKLEGKDRLITRGGCGMRR